MWQESSELTWKIRMKRIRGVVSRLNRSNLCWEKHPFCSLPWCQVWPDAGGKQEREAVIPLHSRDRASRSLLGLHLLSPRSDPDTHTTDKQRHACVQTCCTLAQSDKSWQRLHWAHQWGEDIYFLLICTCAFDSLLFCLLSKRLNQYWTPCQKGGKVHKLHI